MPVTCSLVDSAGKVVRDVYGKQPGYARFLAAWHFVLTKVKLPMSAQARSSCSSRSIASAMR